MLSTFGLSDAAQPTVMRLRVRLVSSVHFGGDRTITVSRTASFGDLRAILEAQFAEESSSSDERQWIFFRDRDRVQVGVGGWDLVANYITEQDVLVVQEVAWGGPAQASSSSKAAQAQQATLAVVPAPSKKSAGRSTSGGDGGVFGWFVGGKKDPQGNTYHHHVQETLEVFPETDYVEVVKQQHCKRNVRRGGGRREDTAFDHQLQEAIRLSKMNHPPARGYTYMEAEPLVSTRPALPHPSPRNDTVGRLVSHGTISQYTMEGGRSACTSICFVAAFEILCELRDHSLGTLSSEILDSFVRKGIQRYKHLQNKHSSIDDLWDMRAFVHMLPHIQKGPTRQGSVARQQDLVDVFQDSLDYAFEAGLDVTNDCDRLAVVLTKSGETVLCVADKLRAKKLSAQKWYLFDSHGQSHETKKLAYWKQFGSFHELLGAFLTKYPPQDFGDGTFQADMYNLFEAVPIIGRKLPLVAEHKDEAHVVSMETDEDSEKFHDSIEPEVIVSPKPPPPNSTPSTTPSTSSVGDTKPSVGYPQGLFVIENFQCAILPDIMADPVVCSDGMVYDRPNIERHFETRREAERERIDQEIARARGEENSEQNEDDCCGCGAARPPIVLTSPVTGEIVDGVLTPVKMVDQQIVMLMEQNYFSLSQEDVTDWHSRREEKKHRDTKRAAEQRRERERQAQMQRNAEAAASRRAEEGVDEEDRFPPQPQEPALQVRIDRDTNDETERLAENDLGISVALSDKVHRIPATYGFQGARGPRCMVSCCAAELQSNQWCSRCARLVCNDCLDFGVTTIFNRPGVNDSLSLICFECASQVADAMETPDILVRQKRAVLIANLERYLTQLSNRAATKQADVVRHETHDEFGSRMEEVEQAICDLEAQLQTVEAQVREQKDRADAATADVHPSTGALANDESDLEELMERVQELHEQYQESLQEGGGDEFDLTIRRTDLASRLEEAQADLAIAMSAASANPLPSVAETAPLEHPGTNGTSAASP